MKRNRTIRNKKKRNALEIFESRSKPKFPTRNHYCRFCVRKNGRYWCRWRQVLFTVYFYFCVSVDLCICQTKHQLDATLCRFYFCRVTLHGSGVKRPSSGVSQIGTMATGTGVIFPGRTSHHHIMDVPNMVMWWPTITHVPGTAVPVF